MDPKNTSEQAAVAGAEQGANSTTDAFTTNTTIAAVIADLVRPGERYAGIVLKADGSISHHLFVLPGDVKGLSWDKAVAWAKEAGGELPTRAEQAVLFGNANSAFVKDWYWSGEQHAAYADYAWCQNFDIGYQLGLIKSASLRARAVRRLPI